MGSFELGDNNTRTKIIYEYCKKKIEKKKEYCYNKC